MTDKIATATGNSNPQSLHHDLWVELTRLEMAMEILNGDAADGTSRKRRLERRRMHLNQAMQLLPE